jgi:tetratricopeptide (TPR) repeat protein
MIGWQRALLAFLLGALMLLMVHPASRALYAAGVWKLGPCETLRTSPLVLANNRPYLPDNPTPVSRDQTNVLVAALWMQASVEVGGIGREDYQKLREVARRQAEVDPNNAFWRQMQSKFEYRLGNRQQALRLWSMAARADTWNDYQSDVLAQLVAEMGREYGQAMAWHFALAYPRRSSHIAGRLEEYGKALLAQAPLDTEEGARIRLDVLLNGRLMRDGSRAYSVGRFGANLVQLAPLPAADSEPRVREIKEARGVFYQSLRRFGLAGEVGAAESAFNTNEFWLAMASTGPSSEAALYRWMAMAAAGVPGALVWVAILGGVIAGVGQLVLRCPRCHVLFSQPLIAVPATLGGILGYLLTASPGAAIMISLGIAIQPGGRSVARSALPTDVGWVGKLALPISVILLLLGLSTAILAQSAPTAYVLPVVEPEGGPVRAMLGSSAFLLGVVFLLFGVVGLFADRLRYSAAKVAGVGMVRVGSYLAIVALAAAVLVGPVAVLADAKAKSFLQPAMLNEPLHDLAR